MKQNYPKIEDLIERFFEGQTSNEEEQELYVFFSSKNIPDYLLPYCRIFSYFETGIKEETNHQTIKKLFSNKKMRIWQASIAASLLLLISFGIYHFTREKEFNPYEGSYIIRNGVKITDPKIVNPEIKKTLYWVQEQGKKQEQWLQCLQEADQRDSYKQKMEEIRQRHLNWVYELEDEYIRNEILKKINIKL